MRGRRHLVEAVPTYQIPQHAMLMQIKYVTVASNFVRGAKLGGEGTLLAKFAGAGYQQVRRGKKWGRGGFGHLLHATRCFNRVVPSTRYVEMPRWMGTSLCRYLRLTWKGP